MYAKSKCTHSKLDLSQKSKTTGFKESNDKLYNAGEEQPH